MSYPTHFVLIYLPNAVSVPLNISTNIRPIYQWLIMGSYKKIGLSHEMGLIDTPPFNETLTNDIVSFEQPGPDVQALAYIR